MNLSISLFTLMLWIGSCSKEEKSSDASSVVTETEKKKDTKEPKDENRRDQSQSTNETEEEAVAFAFGQPSFTEIIQRQKGLNQAARIFVGNGKLLLADRMNHRVLVWNAIPTTQQAHPDLVLGQANLSSIESNRGASATASSMNEPNDVFFDGTRLFVADTKNHRVLVWNQFPTSHGQAADLVLGQSHLTNQSPDRGGSVGAGTLDHPAAVYSTGSRLYVADESNHRVLIWDSVPTVSGVNADVVLGQSAFTSATSNSGGCSGSTLSSPSAILVHGTKLYVADSSNNRILVWNTLPTTSGQAASFAIGQSDLTSNGSATSSSRFDRPRGLIISGSRFFVTDQYNHRVLIWNTIPTGSMDAAHLVLGQSDFTSAVSNSGGVSAKSMQQPQGIASDGSRLFVSDTNNHRVLVWTSIPTANDANADYALGQPSMVTNRSNWAGVSGSVMDQPSAASLVGSKFVVSDRENFRILIRDQMPKGSGQSADRAQGQSSLESSVGGFAAYQMIQPTSFATADGKFFVTDENNNRVLIWNQFPTSSTQDADLVLGQADFTTNTSNPSGVTSSSMSNPNAVLVIHGKLLVCDMGNHRVLVWNTIPTVSGQPADFVLGQSGTTSGAANSGGISASTLNAPSGLAFDGTRLYVADTGNHRVLVWNTLPTANGAPASIVLGQPHFGTSGSNEGGLSRQSLSLPKGMAIHGTKLAIADSNNHRILIWDTLPTTSHAAADRVFGQPDMDSNTANHGGVSATRLNTPVSIFTDGKWTLIGDSGNHRVLGLLAFW